MGMCVYVVARGEQVGRQVGRRLAAGLHHRGDGARIALAADQEDSPLQSKRSSMSLNSNFFIVLSILDLLSSTLTFFYFSVFIFPHTLIHYLQKNHLK